MLRTRVKIYGPMFSKRIDATVQEAIITEGIDRVAERLMRKGPKGSGGRGLGVRRNTIHEVRAYALRLDTISTAGGREHWPRAKGTTWVAKNVAIVRSMLPRVLRKIGRRVAKELGGA